jgi:hypothetical protein
MGANAAFYSRLAKSEVSLTGGGSSVGRARALP